MSTCGKNNHRHTRAPSGVQPVLKDGVRKPAVVATGASPLLCTRALSSRFSVAALLWRSQEAAFSQRRPAGTGVLAALSCTMPAARDLACVHVCRRGGRTDLPHRRAGNGRVCIFLRVAARGLLAGMAERTLYPTMRAAPGAGYYLQGQGRTIAAESSALGALAVPLRCRWAFNVGCLTL